MDMVTETVAQKIERFKLRAELFLRKEGPVFIIDSMNNWHSCYILDINEDDIKVKEFSGKLTGQINEINWVDIIKFEEFRGRV